VAEKNVAEMNVAEMNASGFEAAVLQRDRTRFQPMRRSDKID
jgi:hypothetical protein